MPQLVYIPQLEPDTWRLWSCKGNASCLRDFRHHPPATDYTHTTEYLQNMVQQQPNCVVDAPNHPVKDENFWRQRISEQNTPMGLAPIPSIVGFDFKRERRQTTDKLVGRFKSEVRPLIKYNRIDELRTLLDSWRNRFACIKQKGRFNHWDDDDASSLWSSTSGIGWTSRMLEFCRANGVLNYLSVDGGSLDFALLSMEVGFGISSHKNYFRLGHQDYVKPDGLGVRREDVSFCVVEVKGPKDEGDLYEATLQALCGALAVYAKREMILQISRVARTRRPAVSHAAIAEDGPSLGLYVVMSQYDTKRQNHIVPDAQISEKMHTILEASRLVREIVHIAVDVERNPALSSLPVNSVYRLY